MLEQLRALRKRVPVAGVQARWHKKIARAFRRALDEKRGFNFREALAGKILACVLKHAMALAQNFLHGWPAQIQVAILQANFFVDLWRIVIIGKNWQINRLVEDLNLRGKKFHFTSRKFQIWIASALAQQSLHRNAVLASQTSRGRDNMRRRIFQITHHLAQAVSVAKI